MVRAECPSKPVWPVLAACSLAALLTLTSGVHGEGWGLGLKAGAQSVTHPISGKRSTRPRVEVELASPLYADDHLDVALSIGGASLASITDSAILFDSLGYVEDTYRDNLRLYDLRLAARLYPLGSGPTGYSDDLRVKPYVGGGIGYFAMVDHWKDTHTEVTYDPFDPAFDVSITDTHSGSETWAKGFFPFVTAGVNVAVSSQMDLLFEFQYDFSKVDEGLDFSGPIWMLGCRVRW